MGDDKAKPDRAQRLSDQLRRNLKRRKEQARKRRRKVLPPGGEGQTAR